jgi:chromosome segregation ATPase
MDGKILKCPTCDGFAYRYAESERIEKAASRVRADTRAQLEATKKHLEGAEGRVSTSGQRIRDAEMDLLKAKKQLEHSEASFSEASAGEKPMWQERMSSAEARIAARDQAVWIARAASTKAKDSQTSATQAEKDADLAYRASVTTWQTAMDELLKAKKDVERGCALHTCKCSRNPGSTAA